MFPGTPKITTISNVGYVNSRSQGTSCYYQASISIVRLNQSWKKIILSLMSGGVFQWYIVPNFTFSWKELLKSVINVTTSLLLMTGRKLWFFSSCTLFTISLISQLKVSCGSLLGCIPLRWSGSGSVIQDHSDHGTSKKPMNPLWSWIHQLLLFDAQWSEWSWITPKEHTLSFFSNIFDISFVRWHPNGFDSCHI